MAASRQGGELMSMGSKEIGAVAYIAIKLARYAVSPSHVDTLVDLESYCNLIKRMEMGLVMNKITNYPNQDDYETEEEFNEAQEWYWMELDRQYDEWKDEQLEKDK